MQRESQVPFGAATGGAQSFGTGVAVVAADRTRDREEQEPAPLLAFAVRAPGTAEEERGEHHDAGREVEVLEERGVGSAGRLEVTEELVGADQQVRRDDDPDPPVVEDDADEAEELRDEEPRSVAAERSLRLVGAGSREAASEGLPSSRPPLIVL